MQPLPQVYHSVINAGVCRVNADYHRSMCNLRSGYHPFHCLVSKSGRDKLQFRCIREYAAHTDFNEVAVFPVVINPFLQLLFVSAFHRPAVNLRSFPAVFIFAETFAETPGVTCRVSERHPDNLSVFVRKRTLSNFPHQIRNVRRFIEYHDDAFALVV